MSPTSVLPVTLHVSRHDLPESIREKVVQVLNQTLALVLDLKTQVKFAHWNVKGMQFYALHELFDAMAGELETHLDTLAERATTLGGVAMGTVRLSAQHSTLPEYPYDLHAGERHVAALAERYALLAKHLRTQIDQTADWGDADTADLYTEVSRDVDKRLWFLEAHLTER